MRSENDATLGLAQSERPGRRTFLFIALLAGLVAAGLGVWLGNRPPAEWQTSVFYPQPRSIAPFSLTGSDGGAYTNDDLTGTWDLVFFGFTNCPDVCPNTMSMLAAVSRELEGAGIEPPRVTLISVDPERDDPAQLEQYVRFFDPDFRAATGTPQALQSLARNVGIAFHVADHEPGNRTYTVDHSASVLIIDPQGRLVGLMRPPLQPDAVVADLSRLIES